MTTDTDLCKGLRICHCKVYKSGQLLWQPHFYTYLAVLPLPIISFNQDWCNRLKRSSTVRWWAWNCVGTPISVDGSAIKLLYIELNQWFLIQILLAAFLSNAFSLMFYHVLINITLLLTVSVSDIQLTLYLLAAQRHPLKCNNEMWQQKKHNFCEESSPCSYQGFRFF